MADVNYLLHGNKHFDPEAFIGLYKDFLPDESNPCVQLHKFIFDSLQQIFEKGEITGDRLLDIGSGPVCHNVYAASRWFRDISLSDISETNLDVLRSWKAGERRVADPVLRYMISLDGEREDLETANRRLSEQIKNIVQCDFREKNMLAGTDIDGVMFDALILCLSQSAAAFSYDDFKRNVRNFTTYLKPGGHVIALDSLGCNWYEVGQDTFRTASLKNEEVISAYKECGYDIISWKERNDMRDPSGCGEMTGCFALVGRKR